VEWLEDKNAAFSFSPQPRYRRNRGKWDVIGALPQYSKLVEEILN
jgi:hypothetical protein